MNILYIFVFCGYSIYLTCCMKIHYVFECIDEPICILSDEYLCMNINIYHTN